jgi:hypothetical protein
MTSEMADIGDVPCNEVVNNDNFVAICQKTVAKV